MKTNFLRCELYSIHDDFSIDEDKNINNSVIDSEKKFVRTIITYMSFGKMYELFTGVEFDYSSVEITNKYSKLRKRYVVKEKSKNSAEPLQVSLYFENLEVIGKPNKNYDYATESEISSYYCGILDEFNTIDNYADYLVSLKERAYNKLNDAIKGHSKTKRITMSRII